MPESKPSFLYKIIPVSAAPPDPLPEVLPVSDLDQSSGFIHLSTAVQIPKTLNLFFGSEDRVYILRVPYERIEEDVQWEDPTAAVKGKYGTEGIFPHLYNGLKFGKEVDRVEVLEKGEGWDHAAKNAEWLVY